MEFLVARVAFAVKSDEDEEENKDVPPPASFFGAHCFEAESAFSFQREHFFRYSAALRPPAGAGGTDIWRFP